MATSIDKSTNWRKSADKPDYQVAARRVDTFIQGERNTKSMQVAEALTKTAGVVSQVADRKLEQVTNLEMLRASNYTNELSAEITEFAETYDYSIKDGKRPTSDDVWKSFTSGSPEYQKA